MQRIQKVFSHFLSQVVVLGIVGSFQVILAQNNPPVQEPIHQGNATAESSRIDPRPLSGSPERKTAPANGSALVIGPGDELEVTVYGAPDLSGHARVSADGNVSLPLIGYVRIAGLSSSEAEGAIEAVLRQNNVVNDPQVSLYVKEYTSSGISVAGEVTKPGFYSAVGPRRLFDVLQAAGGPTDRAANKVVISHRYGCSPEGGHRIRARRSNSAGRVRPKLHRGHHGLAGRSCRRRANSRRLGRKNQTASSY